jgi:signal transduction histidine kinase/DNA-binding NarL/FixJ family response regulator
VSIASPRAIFNTQRAERRSAPRSGTLRRELLVVYAETHLNSFKSYALNAAFFLLARIKLYDWPYIQEIFRVKQLSRLNQANFFNPSNWKDGDDAPDFTNLQYIYNVLDLAHVERKLLPLLAAIALLALSAAGLALQRDFYKRGIIGRAQKIQESECPLLMAKLAAIRVLYIVPWLVLLFLPFHDASGNLLYDHLLGYFFVFCSTALYASSSAAVTPLLVFDIGLQLAFVGFFTWVNYALPNTQETLLSAGVFYALFCIYAVYLGMQIQKSQVALVRSKAAIARSAAEKSRFLALMSHEIRTPMTGILGMVEFMKDTNPTKEQSGFIETISECSKTLLNTLNDILDISKLEAGKLEIASVNFDFHGVLNNSVMVLSRMADSKAIYLTLVIEPNVPQRIHLDPHRIQQITMNLLNNAIKFTASGGVTLHAFFIPEKRPLIRVEVTDTGIGISPEGIKKLFRGFSQVNNTIARRYGGTGLGLSIVRDLLIMMGGRVGVNSKEGQGSTFWFEIPYVPPVPEAQETEEQEAELAPLTLLLAEDNKVNQEVALRLLKRKGHHVILAEDGEAAVKAALSRDFDMILMDMNMPVKSGIDAARDIRAKGGKYKAVPIIALTANVVNEYVQQCYAAGMDAHIAKPFNPRELYKAMAKFAPATRVPAPVEKSVPAPVEKLATAPAEKPAPEAPPAAQAAPALVAEEAPPEGAAAPLNENLKEIGEQLGQEYVANLVDKSLKEIGRLLILVKEAFARGDFTALRGSAHDLKGVANLIGMRETFQLAETVDAMLRRNETVYLPPIVKSLIRECQIERAALEKAYGKTRKTA